MSDERHGDQTRDWSFEDVRERMRDAEREVRRAAQEARHEARRAEHAARRSHRVEVSGHGVRIGDATIDGVGIGAFAKGFMKDFMKDVGGEAYSEVVSGEFTFEGMPRLRVRNISGETAVRVGGEGKISVVATKRVGAGSEDRAKRLLQNLEIRMEQHGDELLVEPHLYEQERSWVDLFRGKRFRVDLEITVPPECAVDAHTVSGDLAVIGVSGPQDVQSVSGDVTVEGVTGPLRLKSVSGDIDVRRYVGNVEGSTVSGDVSFEEVRLRSLVLQTVSGDVEVKGVLESAHANRIKTISGDIELALVEPDMVIECQTTSGDLECDIPAQITKRGRKDYTVSCGEGRGRSLVKTVSGDLTIAASDVSVPGEPGEPGVPGEVGAEGPRAEDGAGTDPGTERRTDDVGATVPMNAAERSEVRELLERLARGELGVDDAAAALDQVRKR